MTTYTDVDMFAPPAIDEPPVDVATEHDRDVITDCIRRAVRHDGQVSSNDWRPRIPEGVFHKNVGRTVAWLKRRGVLEITGWDVSNDVKGGNAGKPTRLYRWNGANA